MIGADVFHAETAVRITHTSFPQLPRPSDHVRLPDGREAEVVRVVHQSSGDAARLYVKP